MCTFMTERARSTLTRVKHGQRQLRVAILAAVPQMCGKRLKKPAGQRTMQFLPHAVGQGDPAIR